jgi:hypothetical protein
MIWKHQKNINLKQRKKIKNFQIFSKTFLKRKNEQGHDRLGTLFLLFGFAMQIKID